MPNESISIRTSTRPLGHRPSDRLSHPGQIFGRTCFLMWHKILQTSYITAVTVSVRFVDTGHWILDTGRRTKDEGRWTVDSGRWRCAPSRFHSQAKVPWRRQVSYAAGYGCGQGVGRNRQVVVVVVCKPQHTNRVPHPTANVCLNNFQIVQIKSEAVVHLIEIPSKWISHFVGQHPFRLLHIWIEIILCTDINNRIPNQPHQIHQTDLPLLPLTHFGP